MKKSYLNAIAKIRTLGFTEPAADEIRTNPFSGKARTLKPLAVMLYDFITTREFACGKDYSRQTWDNARYYFLTEWPEAYYDLID